MHEFDSYLNKVLRGLYVSRKSKNEMFEEFKDHLIMLKQENIKQGFIEEEAEKMAIDSFGNTVILKRKLLSNTGSLRTLPNFILGVFFVLAVYLFARNIWMIYPGNQWSMNLKLHFIWMLGGILFFMPFGYFIPLILKRMNKILHIILISSISALFTIKFNLILIGWPVYPSFSLGVVLGGIIGLLVLRLINNIQWGYGNSILKQFKR